MKDVVSFMRSKQALCEGLEHMSRDHDLTHVKRYAAQYVDPCYWEPVREVNWSDRIAWLENETTKEDT